MGTAIQSDYFPSIRLLAEYEIWCNKKILKAVAQLKPDQLVRPFPFGLSHSDEPGKGTIHETLFHIVLVLQRWSGCVGPVIAIPQQREYEPALTIDELSKWNDEVSSTLLDSIDASNAAGLLHQDRRIEQLFHLVTHGTHHRTQIISMLRMLGIDPPFEAGDFGGWSHPRNESNRMISSG